MTLYCSWGCSIQWAEISRLAAPRNRVHAYAWLLLAATEGMPEAVRARDELEATMSKPEVKQA